MTKEKRAIEEMEKVKINIPIFNNIEEAELENKLNFHLEEFTNEIMKTISKDKDIIILKKVIEKQQKEIEELKQEQAERHWVRIKENGEVEPLFCIRKAKVGELKQTIHNTLDKNGITRGYQQIIDKYFDELLEEE